MPAATEQRKKSMSPRFTRPANTLAKTVALEIVEGLGRAVLLIASAGVVVVLGIVLATMSSLP
ncbi:MAG TPA: hypothetical protein VFI58_18975 [Xanthobacteraceae bacterium]|jgi:hypothetical protein|nr:hypothetical protein [Xanthobacteraceae bacterium]